MAAGDRVPPNGGPEAAQPSAPQLLATTISSLKNASEFLNENQKIMFFKSHYLKYRRYADLNLQNIFNSLVGLYSNLIKSQYHRFKRLFDSLCDQVHGVANWTVLARIYVSTWFVDLYVSIREAVQKLSSVAFNEFYHHELIHCSLEYDEFLVALNAAIKPTHVQWASEDALYIPLLSRNPNWNAQTANPFAIQDFSYNIDVFYAIIEMMKSEKIWRITNLSSNTLGRPSWLFDWHANDIACAWFPPDGNFNYEDVTVSYIVGVACTPKLGPRDADDWTYFQHGLVPDNYVSICRRSTERCFYGSYEIRTIEVEKNFHIEIPMREDQLSAAEAAIVKKRKLGDQSQGKSAASEPQALVPATSSSSEIMHYAVPAPRYKIIDWLYYCMVIQGTDSHTRTGAHRMIAFN